MLWILGFALTAYYIFFIETEKFESKSVIMIKDLSAGQTVSPLGSLLSGGLDSGMSQDAELLKVYVESDEMYSLLDKDFNLTAYYQSDKIDPIHRLTNRFKIPFFEVNQVNLLFKYQADLHIIFDEASGTLNIAFAHANAKTAKEIVEKIIDYAGKRLNFFEKENFKIVLKFLKQEKIEKYSQFEASVKKLLDYQHKHRTFDPQFDLESKSSVLASFEAKLMEKEVEYKSKLEYLNANSSEMQILKNSMNQIRKTISKIKKEITGSKGKEKLTVDISKFEFLKSEVEFNKEVYKQVLIKIEETNVLVKQNAKNIMVVSKANVSDAYSYPHKTKNAFSLLIIFLFLYGVVSMIIRLIQDHKD